MVRELDAFFLHPVLRWTHADLAGKGARKVGRIVEAHGTSYLGNGDMAGCQQEASLFHPSVLDVLVWGPSHGHTEQPYEMIAADASKLGQFVKAQAFVNAFLDQVEHILELPGMNALRCFGSRWAVVIGQVV